MDTESSSLDLLRQLAARQGVFPTHEDLEAVLPFLDAILPALEELERTVPPDTVPAEESQP
ncbi:MAG: hypothetical protein ACRDPV_16035 [Gaiellaceae bacterium]